jgi:hypothetical protein
LLAGTGLPASETWRTTMIRNCFGLTVLLTVLIASSAAAEDWFDLKAKFVYDGAAAKPAPVDITKDQAVCGKHNLVDESLVIAKDGAVANVVAYLYVGRGSAKPPVHESYAKTANAEVQLNNVNCRYEPHVALLRTTQTLVIGNKDPVGHNTKIDPFFNTPVNPIIPASGQLKQKFPIAERLPVPVSCSIHPWMKAWLLVQETPYMAVSDKEGNLEIKNVPAGEWTFQFYHEKAGFVREVILDGKPTEWSKGRLEINIEGDTDLGEVRLPASLFE